MADGRTKQSRRAHEPRHIRLYHTVTGCPAWLDLSGNAVKLLVAMMRLENGSNNGELFLSARLGASIIGVGKNTASKLFAELEDHGFIRSTQRGYFKVKNGPATSWRLTWLAWPGHGGPTRDFEKWEPAGNKTRSQFLDVPVPETGTVPGNVSATVPKRGTGSTGTRGVPSAPAVPETGTQTVCHRHSAELAEPHPVPRQGPEGWGGADASDQRADELRETVQRWLAEAPVGTQKKIGAAAGIPASSFSKFLTTAKPLDRSRLDRLAAVMSDLQSRDLARGASKNGRASGHYSQARPHHAGGTRHD